MVGTDYIGGFGTTLAEKSERPGTTLRENGPTLFENSPITSPMNHIEREHHSGTPGQRSGFTGARFR
ncbi:hypothetical protein, partial [Cupriavidus sp. 8B]